MAVACSRLDRDQFGVESYRLILNPTACGIVFTGKKRLRLPQSQPRYANVLFVDCALDFLNAFINLKADNRPDTRAN